MHLFMKEISISLEMYERILACYVAERLTANAYDGLYDENGMDS